MDRKRITDKLPFGWVRTISRKHAAEYLIRYSVRSQEKGSRKEWRIYLHNLLAEDEGFYHNHPSKWCLSIILFGSYEEELIKPSRVLRNIKWFNWIPHTHYHKITKLHPRFPCRGVWTLFIAGPAETDKCGNVRDWDFYWNPMLCRQPNS